MTTSLSLLDEKVPIRRGLRRPEVRLHPAVRGAVVLAPAGAGAGAIVGARRGAVLDRVGDGVGYVLGASPLVVVEVAQDQELGVVRGQVVAAVARRTRYRRDGGGRGRG